MKSLLEREQALGALNAALARAARGAGLCVLVSGEAGIGKSSLLAAFESGARNDAEFHLGYCDALQSPRPLAPLFDMASTLNLSLYDSSGNVFTSHVLFDKLSDCLRNAAKPVVLVFEDLHWADQGTLDLVRYLSRRVQRLSVLVVLSFRSDEVVAEHPLRAVLGELNPDSVLRMPLARLSKSALATLASAQRIDVDALFKATHGNPFYATEVIASGGTNAVPITVRDAVLTRLSRLTAEQRAIANAVSIIPGHADLALIGSLINTYTSSALTGCIASGVLIDLDEGAAVQFRHELARRACEASLSIAERQSLHARALEILRQTSPNDAARAVHHALGAGNPAAVLEIAPRAAAQAAHVGAHREAAAHYAAALAAIASGAITTSEIEADLHQHWSYEAGLVRIGDETIAARREAIRRFRDLGNMERVALNCRWAARLHWYRGESTEAQRYAEAALSALENRPASPEKAWGYSTISQRAMLNNETAKAIDFGHQALELAERVGALEVKAHALNNIGSAKVFAGDETGLESLMQSLTISREHGFHEQTARVYTNMAAYGVSAHKLELAERYASEGLEFDRNHDLDSWTYYLEGVYAQVLLLRGRFDEAEAAATQALSHDASTALMRLPALTVRLFVQLRSGHRDAARTLAETDAIASASGEFQRLFPVLIAQAETAWLAGDNAAVLRYIAHIQTFAMHDSNPWEFGEAIIFKHRVGIDQSAHIDKVARPYALEIAGDLPGAANLWREIGNPFCEATVLARGNTEQRLAALDLFDGLGAKSAAEFIRRWARENGIVGIKGAPRGLYRARRENPLGVSAKELEVLQLLAEGKTNQEISDELFRAPKTVEHHVSSLLAKLDARNRVEAARRAIELGLVNAMKSAQKVSPMVPREPRRA